MKLMLIEDEYLLNKAIKTYLVSKNFEVESFIDGMEALEALERHYDLFIVDIDIPNINGIEILEQIRSFYAQTPVIMISATIDMGMITKAYTLGCNDYLKKPFDIKELELKIRALTRNAEDYILLSNELKFIKSRQEVEYQSNSIALTPKESKILLLLLENRGRIVSHMQLEMYVWGDQTDSSHVRQVINRLRKKLPATLIQNRPGEGYIIV